jgi:hypothetical protein
MRGIAALKKAGMLVILSYVVLPELNMDEAPHLLDLVQQLGVAVAKFARPVHKGTNFRPTSSWNTPFHWDPTSSPR